MNTFLITIVSKKAHKNNHNKIVIKNLFGKMHIMSTILSA